MPNTVEAHVLPVSCTLISASSILLLKAEIVFQDAGIVCKKLTMRPSSKLITPAKARAQYSPRLNPAHALQFSTVLGFSTRSFSTAASPATNKAGWANSVSSSFSFGPFKHRSKRSYPRMAFALISISLTAGTSLESYQSREIRMCTNKQD